VRLVVAVVLSTCCGLAAAQAVPLPRPRPALLATTPDVVEPERAQSDSAEPQEPPAPSACRLRLTSDLAVAPSLPPLVGAGECGVEDVVRLEAVVLADKSKVTLTPPATVRCTFAEAIVQWVREDVAPRVRKARDTALKGIDNYDSYDCRGRNRVVGAKLSEHGKANALDVRSLKLANGAALGLADPNVSKDLRESLRKATCTRFHTVLGPGSDGYHEDHVHMDLAERRGDYRICHWDVRVPEEAVIAEQIPLPRPRPTVSVKQQ
jgi:hypothetical protein